jgi:ribonuclease HI
MAVHEDAERLALPGVLEALEAAWSQAEEIAAIADSLLVPDAVMQAIARFRAKLTGGN